MELNVINYQGQQIGEGPKGKPFLTSATKSTLLVEACGNAGVYKMILYPENLPSKFFDLSSREAGEVLGKLRIYQIQLAVVRTPELQLSTRFAEILGEERRSGYFGLFDTRDEALDWLVEL